MPKVSVRNTLFATLLATVAVSQIPAARADFASDVQECQRCLDQAKIKEQQRAMAWGFFGALATALSGGAAGACIIVGAGGASASAVSDEISGDGCGSNSGCYAVMQANQKWDETRREHNCH